ncbi:MAG: hypothetical protein IOC39_00690 [Burkholderia sp.]|jgi:hypothetical protein|uniref:hypothetical protein n=1 Tax=Burkholderia TaxID=32008 RepID=UPI00158F5230|nr:MULTISPECIES: hypothetical protein [Burkholderia]MBY8608227.1 hypothetical protein [Burkholderia arboris]MCA3781366.1 hypothetical protein [Burkholderia sp.]MCA3789536.1 hypothetical protein [Burkholderia sp.]MCA3795458.1 hypothetical protein [Burkholderia sp.]MCA3805338.1 hypothetical protein [Burkholderia sp.]
MTETSIVERIVQYCENAGKSNPLAVNQRRKNGNDGLFEKSGGRLREGNHGLLPPLDFRILVNLPVQNGRARVVLN